MPIFTNESYRKAVSDIDLSMKYFENVLKVSTDKGDLGGRVDALRNKINNFEDIKKHIETDISSINNYYNSGLKGKIRKWIDSTFKQSPLARANSMEGRISKELENLGVTYEKTTFEYLKAFMPKEMPIVQEQKTQEIPPPPENISTQEQSPTENAPPHQEQDTNKTIPIPREITSPEEQVSTENIPPHEEQDTNNTGSIPVENNPLEKEEVIEGIVVSQPEGYGAPRDLAIVSNNPEETPPVPEQETQLANPTEQGIVQGFMGTLGRLFTSEKRDSAITADQSGKGVTSSAEKKPQASSPGRLARIYDASVSFFGFGKKSTPTKTTGVFFDAMKPGYQSMQRYEDEIKRKGKTK